MSSLEHHGIKGQKWGVRRYQNPDGTLTSLGKKRAKFLRNYMYVRKTAKDVDDIFYSMNKEERGRYTGGYDVSYLPPVGYKYVLKRFIKKVGGTPVAFLDVQYSDEYYNTAKINVGTRADDKYRGKGYALELTKKAQKWFESPYAKDALKLDFLLYDVWSTNAPSIRVAEKAGFDEVNVPHAEGATEWLRRFQKKQKR